MGTCNSTQNKKKEGTVVSMNKKDEQKEPQKTMNKPPENPVPPPVQKIKPADIQIIVRENDVIVHDQKYVVTQTLKDVYDNLSLEKNCDYELITSNDETILDKLQVKLETLFKKQLRVELSLVYVGLILPEYIRTAYEDTKILATVMLDNPDQFGITTFDSSLSKATTYSYSLAVNNLLRKFNSFSAFCNGKNKIFISGGELGTTEYLKEFIQIDLENLTERDFQLTSLPELIQARTWHSMIYVPDNYIFIVSGTGNKTVEIYDMKNNTIQLDSELNQERSECTLCCFNNSELYVFCGFLMRESFLTSIEKCNLKKGKRMWENVPYTLQQNITFVPSFFSIGFYQEDSVILFGSNENSEEKNKSYLFQLNDGEETMSEYKLNENLTGVLREKFFIPLDDKLSFILPIVSKNIQVYFLNSEDGQIKKTEIKPLTANIPA